MVPFYSSTERRKRIPRMAIGRYDFLVMRITNGLSILLVLSLGVAPSFSQGQRSRQADIAAHSRKAQSYLSEHQPELAAREFQAVVALDPNNVDARANLGILLFFQKDYRDAVSQLRTALKLKPGMWRVQALLGQCEKRLGDEAAARRDLEAAFPHVEEAQIKIDVGRDLIDIYSASGDLDKAATTISSLIRVEPSNPGLLYAAYRIYSDLAEEAIGGLSAAAPDSGQMHQAMAHELFRERDLRGAIANFRKAIAIDPNLPGIHFELAEALRMSADPKLRGEAEKEYELALQRNSRNEKAMARLGDIADERNDLEVATVYYKQALGLAPEDAEAEIGMAKVDAERNNNAAAAALLEHVISADPSNLVAHYRLSAAYRSLGRPEDARQQIEEYQKYTAMKEKAQEDYQSKQLDTPPGEASEAGK